MDFTVAIHRADEGGYWAEVPSLEGCFVHGETIEERLADAPEAITPPLEARREDGQAPPRDGGVIVASVRAGRVPAA